MKRVKNEQIRNVVSHYLKRRQYQDTETNSNTSIKQDNRKEQTTELGDMSVKKRMRINSSVENCVACSSIAGDSNSCDQQFGKLRKFVLESTDTQSAELSALLYPIFVHIYSDLLSAGHKASAHKFHERYSEIFHTDEQKDFIRSLRKLESRTELLASKEITDFRENKFAVSLSHVSIASLLKYLKGGDNMIILQILNQHINIQVTKGAATSLELIHPIPSTSASSTSISSTSMPSSVSSTSLPSSSMSSTSLPSTSADAYAKEQTDRDKEKKQPEDGAVNFSQMSPEDAELYKALKETIRKVRALPPSLPSICFYTFINAYQGLCTSNVSPDSKLICGGFEDSSVMFWRLLPETLRTQPTDCCNSNITLAADYIYRDEEECTVKIDTESQEAITLKAHNGAVYKTCFTPDSEYILSCSKDTTVRMWNIETRTNCAIYHGHSGAVWDLDFCQATCHFATSSRDQTVKLWTTDRIYPLRSFVGHTYDVDCVAIHPNGNYVASGSGDHTVRLWNIQDGKPLRVLTGHRGSILALAFSPNGQMLASAGDDRRVHVWDLASGSLLKELRGHSDTVHSLAFSYDNAMVASGGLDCYIRIWDVRRGVENTGSSLVEGHTSAELLGAFPTKSATVSFLRFARCNLLLAAGAIQ